MNQSQAYIFLLNKTHTYKYEIHILAVYWRGKKEIMHCGDWSTEIEKKEKEKRNKI